MSKRTKNMDIVETEHGVRMFFNNDPTNVSRGHSPHKSGAGPHKDKRDKRKRGNQQKRQWLDEE